MPSLAEIRQQYPQYGDMSDADLAAALHQKFYADMPREEFDTRMGLKPAAQQPAAKRRGVMDYAEDAVRSIASGVTFGTMDEIAAWLDEKTGRGGTYEQNLAAQRARDKEISPAVGIPGEIAGAVGGTVAALPVTGPAAAVSGLSRLPAAARYIAGGAAGGAAYGAGSAEEGQRASGAMTGGAFGAGAGFVAPYVARGAVGAYNAVRGAVSPQANVAADLGRALVRDDTTPQELAQRLRDAQADRPGVATLADVGGENVRGLVERVAQTPGAGRTIVTPTLTTRQQNQLGRLTNDLQSLTGTRQAAHEAIEETMARRQETADPLYRRAFDFNARENAEIVNAWNQTTSTGWGQHVLRSPEFRRNLQTEYGIRNPADAPLMVQIDAWQKAARDIVESARDAGANNRARVVGGMRNSMLEIVDRANPTYGEARAAWAGPSQFLQALNEGRNILNNRNVGADELIAGLARMADVDREAYRIGAVSAIQAKMGNDPAKLADLTKYLRSPENRRKIAAIMPTPEAREAWARRLDFEIGASELTGRALGNSATARRLAEKQDAEGIVGDLVMDAFMGQPPLSIFRRMVGAVPRRIRDTLRSRSDEILGELLLDPQGMATVQRALDRAEARTPPGGPSAVRDIATTRGANAAIND